MPRQQRDRAEMRDRYLRPHRAPSSSSSPPVAVSVRARAAHPFRRHRSNRRRQRRIMTQHARARPVLASSRHVTSESAPNSAIATFVATVLRRRPPRPSPSRRTREPHVRSDDTDRPTTTTTNNDATRARARRTCHVMSTARDAPKSAIVTPSSRPCSVVVVLPNRRRPVAARAAHPFRRHRSTDDDNDE